MLDAIWGGGITASLTAGQRTGNWDWGVGLAWFTGDDDVFGTGFSSSVFPCWSWGFRF